MDLKLLAEALRAAADVLDGRRPEPPIEENDPAVEEVSLSEIQELAASKIKAGDREQVVECLNDFGVKKISALDPDDYKSFRDLLI